MLSLCQCVKRGCNYWVVCNKVAEHFTCNGNYITRKNRWSFYFHGVEGGRGTSLPTTNTKMSTWSKVMVKESRKRPGVAQKVPGVLGSQISRYSAHEGGEVVSLTHRPPLPPRNVPGTHFH